MVIKRDKLEEYFKKMTELREQLRAKAADMAQIRNQTGFYDRLSIEKMIASIPRQRYPFRVRSLTDKNLKQALSKQTNAQRYSKKKDWLQSSRS